MKFLELQSTELSNYSVKGILVLIKANIFQTISFKLLGKNLVVGVFFWEETHC